MKEKVFQKVDKLMRSRTKILNKYLVKREFKYLIWFEITMRMNQIEVLTKDEIEQVITGLEG